LEVEIQHYQEITAASADKGMLKKGTEADSQDGPRYDFVDLLRLFGCFTYTAAPEGEKTSSAKKNSKRCLLR